MATMASYQGVVRQGHIQLTPAADLPEGSQVYVLVPADAAPPPLLDAHLARRKANGWLISHVGHVMAQQPQLTQIADRLVWRFAAYLTLRDTPTAGPVGSVYVDAYQGEVLNTPADAEEMIVNATALVASLPSAEG